MHGVGASCYAITERMKAMADHGNYKWEPTVDTDNELINIGSDRSFFSCTIFFAN